MDLPSVQQRHGPFAVPQAHPAPIHQQTALTRDQARDQIQGTQLGSKGSHSYTGTSDGAAGKHRQGEYGALVVPELDGLRLH